MYYNKLFVFRIFLQATKLKVKFITSRIELIETELFRFGLILKTAGLCYWVNYNT